MRHYVKELDHAAALKEFKAALMEIEGNPESLAMAWKVGAFAINRKGVTV